MADAGKRKQAPGGDRDGGGAKRRQGGSGGKWQTPHAKTKALTPRGGSIDPGDVGIWVTCMKNKEGKATEELKVLFDEYAEQFYGITNDDNDDDDDDDSGEKDIESTIAAELSTIKPSSKKQKLFQPVWVDVRCVLFFKTHSPIDPVDFVTKISKEAAKGGRRKCRFVNRLTPVSAIGRATDKGLQDLGRSVFNGAGFDVVADGAAQGDGVAEEEVGSSFSYAIRPTIRNHNTLKREVIIPLIANLISTKHKVNLTKPDKVIIVEIYQTICGISVVDGPSWDGDLKRFNLFEIYQAGDEKFKAEKSAAATAEAVEGRQVEVSGEVSGEVDGEVKAADRGEGVHQSNEQGAEKYVAAG